MMPEMLQFLNSAPEGDAEHNAMGSTVAAAWVWVAALFRLSWTADLCVNVLAALTVLIQF